MGTRELTFLPEASLLYFVTSRCRQPGSAEWLDLAHRFARITSRRCPRRSQQNVVSLYVGAGGCL